MKYIIQFIFLTCISIAGFSQSMEEIIFPQYTFSNSGDLETNIQEAMPYIFKAKLTGLAPNTTFKYLTRFIDPNSPVTSVTAGAAIIVQSDGQLTGGSASIFNATSSYGYGTLTTDATGSYTGWFGTEAYLRQSLNEYKVRIFLNNGSTGLTVAYRITSNLTVKIINYKVRPEDADAMPGTLLRSTPATGGTPKNFVILYDNAEGTGRPVSSAIIQDANLTRNRIAYFGMYKNDVDGKDHVWGAIIPNDLPNGIRRLEQYSIQTGTLAGFNTSPDGLWDGPDGNMANTVNPSGDATHAIVINGSLHSLLQDRPAQTVNFAPLPGKTYGDAPFQLTASASSGLTDFVFTSSDPAVASITGNTVTVHSPGASIITATQLGNSNFMRASASQTLTISPAGQIINFDALPAKMYGNEPFDLSATATSGLPVSFRSSDERIAVVSGNTVTIKKAGNVDIIASQAGNANFPAAPEETRRLVIDKAPLTITADRKSKAVGEANPVLTFQYNGFQYNDNLDSLTTPVTISTAAGQNSPEDDYPVTVTGATSGNYEISFVNALLSVYNQTQTITWALPSKTYGDMPFDPGAVSATGATPVYSSSDPRVAIIDENGKIKITGAGAVYVTAAFPEANSLPFTTKDQLLTVDKADLEIKPANKIRTYGAADPVFTATYTGLVYGEQESDLAVKPVFQTIATVDSPVGDYPITASSAKSANYNISYQPGNLSVQKAALTAAADNKTRMYGQENPLFTVTYTGFVNGESGNVLTTQATATTIASSITSIGDYPITVSGGSAANYEIGYQSGTLTITPADRAIAFNPLPVTLVGSADLDLAATISSGEEPVYTSSDPDVATIVNNKIHVVGAGNAMVTATAPVNPNYGDEPLTVGRRLVVNKGLQTISLNTFPVSLVKGVPVVLDISSNSGLPVQLSIGDPSMVILNGNTLTPLQIGAIRITFSQQGNDAWLPAKEIVKDMQIVESNNLEAWTSSRSTLEVRIYAPKAQRSVIQLLSLDGKKLYSTESQLRGGTNQVQIPVRNIPVGIYMLYVQGEDFKKGIKALVR